MVIKRRRPPSSVNVYLISPVPNVKNLLPALAIHAKTVVLAQHSMKRSTLAHVRLTSPVAIVK